MKPSPPPPTHSTFPVHAQSSGPTVARAVVLMAHAVVTKGTGGRADADLAHVLAVQEHEVAALARDAAIDGRAARATAGAHRVATDDG